MCSKNREYLNMLFKLYGEHGYCNIKKPIIYKPQIGKQGKIYYSGKLNLYTFISLKWLFDLFYIKEINSCKYIKTIPDSIEYWLNAQALAIWFMDDGSYYQGGVMFSTYCFTYNEQIQLKKALYNNFYQNSTIYLRSAGYIQVLKKIEMSKFITIVEPYIITSMLYKIKKGNTPKRSNNR